MADPTWPANLPYAPDLQTYRVQEPFKPVTWTEFEDGPPIARRSGLLQRAKIQQRIVFVKRSDYANFKSFLKTTLMDGTVRFTMPVYVPDTDSYQTKTCMFDQSQGPPVTDTFGLGFSVSMTLIVFDW